MPRGTKPTKAKRAARARRPAAPRGDGARRELERRLAAALEHQVATADILRTITRSPGDAQPVFEAIVASAARLCEADFSAVARLEGGRLHLVATSNTSAAEAAAYQSLFPRPPTRGFIIGRAVLDGRPVHVEDVRADPDYEARTLEVLQKAAPYRSYLGIPIVVGGEAIGAIGCGRRAVCAFTPEQVELVQTFAEQVAIAVENARLFATAEARNRDLAESLDQQTATSEVLKVISRSTFDLRPVLESLLESATRLCGATRAHAVTLDGERLRFAAAYGAEPGFEAYLAEHPLPLGPGSAAGRAAAERRAVHIHDVRADPGYEWGGLVQRQDYRTVLAVPLLREDALLGVIAILKSRVEPFTDKQIDLVRTFADQAVIAIENVRLLTELTGKNRDLAESLEQQTATAEILRAISSSPTDIEPVLETVVRAAARFCGATDVALMRLEGDLLRTAAAVGRFRDVLVREAGSLGAVTVPVTRGSVTGRAVVDRQTVHVFDPANTPDDEYPELRALQRRFGHGTVAATPLLREGTPLGAIGLFRMTVDPFSDRQLAMLRTFADQAVIAIENVRLFTEVQGKNRDLAEALEQQTATSAVLRIISTSPTDLRPVLATVAENAARLCAADEGHIWQRDGDEAYLAASWGGRPVARQRLSLGRRSVVGRAIHDRELVHVADLAASLEGEFPDSRPMSDLGYKTILSVPLLREGSAIGAIMIRRTEVRPFTDNQVDLVKTFADQAVIAIENVRLFTELDVRNRELTETLEQQTATGDILRVISSSPTDVQPVFDAIASSAVRLCEAMAGGLLPFDGEHLHVGALDGPGAERIHQAWKSFFPYRPGPEVAIGQAVLERRVIHMKDVLAQPANPLRQATQRAGGFRAFLAVPLMREDAVLGVIACWRADARPFSDRQIGLMQTFADQAVIAIENVRLFTELDARTHELTRSVGELRALGDVSRAVSSSLDLETVLATIVSRAAELSGSQMGIVYEFDEAERSFHARATHGVSAQLMAAIREAPIRLGESAVGRAGVTRQPVEVADLEDGREIVAARARAGMLRDGMRSFLAVPLVREDRLLGGLAIARRDRGAFSPEVVATLQTFAAQSVLAMHNAGLFREIQRQKQYSDALLETSPVAIITMDLGGAVVGWNPGAERLFGHTPAEALGRPMEDLVATPDVRDEVRANIRHTLQGEWIRAIARRARKDGTPVDVEISSVPVEVDGARVGMIGIYHDITELSQARREAEAANEAKTAFLATMSHEIRTPMNAVIGMSGLLLNTALSDEQREYAEVVRQSGDALLTVINDILDFSKIEAGRLELESQPFDLRECVEGALDLVATRAADKGIDLAYVMGDGTPAGIAGDVTRLRQVLLNLLSNAVKFTERGEVVLTVGSHRPEAAAPDVHDLTFAVRDTGIGIPADRLDRLFQSFSQVDASTTRRYGGTGLGLAISQRLAEMMGGRITVTSQEGAGSEFRFTIRASAAEAPVPTRRDLSGVQPRLSGKRVLVVDDNATNRRILTAHLQNWGMTSQASASPVEALGWIRAGERYDIGILDMHMPEMDGVALARAVREHPAGSDLPLVLFTSLGRREARADEEGFAAYLHKPIKPSQLFDTLISILAERPVHVSQRPAARLELDPEMGRRHPLRILLAEDNVVNQKVALRLLAQMGYRADVAANGREAIDAVERQTYDVILMDVQMPEMDGFEASREITGRWAAAARPRIVAMTANAMQGDRELCAAAGMDDYVAKPIRVEELVAALERTARRAGGRTRAASEGEARGAPPPHDPGAGPTAGAVASAAPAPGPAAVDRAAVDRLVASMGAAFVVELIDTFEADAREQIAALARAGAAGEVDVFRRAAHSLKSTSESLGAAALAELARELETEARTGRLDGTAERLAGVPPAFEAAARALAEIRHALSA